MIKFVQVPCPSSCPSSGSSGEFSYPTENWRRRGPSTAAWGERRLGQEGQDDVSRLTEAAHRQVPQLRYARAECRGVERAADEVAQR